MLDGLTVHSPQHAEAGMAVGHSALASPALLFHLVRTFIA